MSPPELFPKDAWFPVVPELGMFLQNESDATPAEVYQFANWIAEVYFRIPREPREAILLEFQEYYPRMAPDFSTKDDTESCFKLVISAAFRRNGEQTYAELNDSHFQIWFNTDLLRPISGPVFLWITAHEFAHVFQHATESPLIDEFKGFNGDREQNGHELEADSIARSWGFDSFDLRYRA